MTHSLRALGRGTVVFAALAFLSTACATAPPPKDCSAGGADVVQDSPEARKKLLGELFAVLEMERLFNESIESALKAQVAQNPELLQVEGVMRDFFADYMSWKSLEPEITKLYLETFSAQEMADIAAFYKTPTGRKARDTMPTLMAEGMKLGQARVQEHSSELERRVIEHMSKGAAPEGGQPTN